MVMAASAWVRLGRVAGGVVLVVLVARGLALAESLRSVVRFVVRLVAFVVVFGAVFVVVFGTVFSLVFSLVFRWVFLGGFGVWVFVRGVFTGVWLDQVGLM